ncbi:unnamed protein product [Brachionus calyciflorus]|uniref:Neurotransmitter-gated ion-channel ligand-binding domain-containing protein n=1 Tax=Brachionus calyciflorus TaxID=104777 RepID=A0A813R3M9_9BILA|nr:unnamed protein product [Brachionus calyciflorus]
MISLWITISAMLIIFKANYACCLYEQDISSRILENYDKLIKQSGKIELKITFFLRQLIGMDEKNQIMTTNSYVAQEWIDPRLKWEPSEYSNTNRIIIQAKKIWQPELAFLNVADGDGFLKISDQNLAIVESTGLVYLIVSSNSLRTRCKMNIIKFPFDEQTCEIRLASWLLSTYDIDINQADCRPPIWDLINITNEADINSDRFIGLENYETDDAIFKFKFKRRPLYHMINGVFPNFVLNILLLLVYFLPEKSQIGLTLAIILATSMNLVRASSDIPVQSDYLPYMTLYFIFCHIYNILSLTFFTIESFLLSKGYLPKWLMFLCTKIRKSLCEKNDAPKLKQIETNPENVIIDKKEEQSNDKCKKINKEILKDADLKCNCETKSEKDMEKEKEKKHFQQCMNIIHYTLQLFMFLFMVISNLTIWLIIVL